MQFEFQAATTIQTCKEKKIYTFCRLLFLNSITNFGKSTELHSHSTTCELETSPPSGQFENVLMNGLLKLFGIHIKKKSCDKHFTTFLIEQRLSKEYL